MRFALDYDDTFTAHRDGFTRFVRDAQSGNPVNTVTFVTLRASNGCNGDIEGDAKELDIDIVYCNGRQKSECFNADVWIDDMPEVIPSAHMMRMCLQSEELLIERTKENID